MAPLHWPNDAHYLDHHLSHVVAQLSAQGEVEIYGVGVGLDLSPYHRQNRASTCRTR